MLRIGFTNKFYTLWDVSTEIVYSEMSGGTIMCQPTYATHQKTHYHYLQNLSFDIDKAKEKAAEKGCKDLEVDEELFGRNSYFFKEKSLVSHLPVHLLSTFEFGKYRGQQISESDDLNYVKWYWSETKSFFAEKLLIENGFIAVQKWADDPNCIVMMTKEEYEAYKNEGSVKAEFESLTEVIVEPTRNIYKTWSDERNEETFTLDAEYKGIKVSLEFDDVREMYYNGITYYLPVQKGKAKKIKGKRLLIQKSSNKVNKFEILK